MKKLLLVAILVLLVNTTPVWAGSVEDAIAQLQTQVQELQGRLATQEANNVKLTTRCNEQEAELTKYQEIHTDKHILHTGLSEVNILDNLALAGDLTGVVQGNIGNKIANDETLQFLSPGLVNSPAVEWPDDNGAGGRL